MSGVRTIACADCGAEYETTRSNTKYCGVCRLWRDMLYLEKDRADCLDCEAKFIPLRRGERLCGACDFIGRRVYAAGQCALCGGTERPLLREEARICLGCAKDPDKRGDVLAALAKKRRRQRAHAE